MPTGEFIALNTCLRKEERLTNNNVNIHIRMLGKGEQITSERKKEGVMKSRTQRHENE